MPGGSPKESYVAHKKALDAGDAKLARKWATRLLKENLAFVRMMVRRFEGQWQLPIPHEDLEQAGVMGFLRGLKTYNPERAKPSTYMGDWIRYFHQQLAQQEGHRIKKSVPRAVMQAIQEFVKLHGRDPTPEEMGISSALHAVAVAPPIRFVGLYEDPDDAEDSPACKRHVPSPSLDLDTRMALKQGLLAMDAKTREIFTRFADSDGNTRKLAKDLGVLEIVVLDAIDKGRKVLILALSDKDNL